MQLHKSENAYRPGVHSDNVPKEDMDTQVNCHMGNIFISYNRIAKKKIVRKR